MGELRAGGGYDSNPALAADPGNRRLPAGGGRPAPPSMEDGVVRLSGFLAASLGDSPRLAARLDLDGRVYGSGSFLFAERLALEGMISADLLTGRCRVEGSRLDVSSSEDSAFAGALACGALVRLPLGFWVGADAEGGIRSFDFGQLDGIGGGSVRAGVELDVLAFEVGLSVLARESTERDARRVEIAPWAVLRADTEYVGGQLAYRYVARVFEMEPRSGAEHTGRLEVWAMPLPWIGVFAELELGHAEGGAQALVYDRVQVLAGARLLLEWHSSLPPLAPSEQGPASIEDGWVRFRFDLPDAREVAVVGDFNGWSRARGRLERLEDGRFEGRFRVRSGRHEYHLVIDGEPARPPGAERYVTDDFGGENGVLVVP